MSKVRPCQIPDATLSAEQRQIVFGTMFGDGHLRDHTKWGGNSTLTIAHSSKEYDYLCWLRAKLCPFVGGVFHRPSRPSPLVPNSKDSYVLYSIRHPEFSRLRLRFYPHGKKTVPPDLLSELGPLGIAVWIMDDGTFNTWANKVQVATERYTAEENELLRDHLAGFGLTSSVVKASYGSGHRLYISARSTATLQDLLRDHVPPCMYHKLGLSSG